MGGILLIGVLGDRGAPSRPGPGTTTTSTTTVPPPATTSTTFVPIGPTLPFQTNTAVLLVGSAAPKLLQLDTGALQAVDGAGIDATPLGPGFVYSTPPRLSMLRSTGERHTFVDGELDRRGRMVSADGQRLWVPRRSGDGALTMVEIDLAAHETGRRLTLPAGTEVVGAVDQGLVVAQFGSITLVDADRGSGLDLGTGTVVAAGGHQVAVVACPELRCRLSIVDTRTGTTSLVDGPAVTGVEDATFSRDGRWLAVRVESASDRRFLLVVDAAAHRVGPPVEDGEAFAFTLVGDVLVVVDRGHLRAVELPSGDAHELDLPLIPARRLVTAPAP